MNEKTSQTNPPPPPSMFSQLVIMIATSALQQLGQVPDPSGRQGPISLEGAQGMIDILETLETKTKGNLDNVEQKMLSDSLTMLRLHYVEAAQHRGDRPAPETPPPPSAEPAPEEAAAPQDEPVQGGPEQEEGKTRYRKSYG
jgi:hypothetical protein